ncbi:MAG: penicillin-binding transpeptidase domain-containing protein [Bacteroidota bacterium]
MKRLLLFAIVLFCCTFTVLSQEKPDQLRQQLNGILDQWHKDAARCELSRYINAMDTGGVFLGTDPGEYWKREEFRSFCKPYFEKKTSWDFRVVSRNLYLDSDRKFAWFDEVLMTQMGICRGSGVICLKAGNWLIEQYVLSPTIPNDLMKKVTALKASEDSMLMIQSVFEKYGLNGTMIIYDPKKDRYFGFHPELWDVPYIPASTFKIPNSLIGLETRVIDTSYIFKWDGKARRLKQWENDLTLREAFAVSCVPCYQEVARKIGAVRMRNYLEKFQYGKMDVSDSTIDKFWLEGNSGITPRQQIYFLRKLHDGDLPLQASTMAEVRSIMLNEKSPSFTLYGKTGWAVRNGNNYGWFVGYLETGDKVIYLATLVVPKEKELPADFSIARKWVSLEVLRLLKFIPE